MSSFTSHTTPTRCGTGWTVGPVAWGHIQESDLRIAKFVRVGRLAFRWYIKSGK